MPVTRLLAIFLALLFQAAVAQAQSCTFANTGVNFGNVNLAANIAYTATGTFTATCSGTANRRILICPNFGAGTGGVAGSGNPRFMTQGATRLNYNLFEANNFSDVWGSNLWAPNQSVNPIIINLSGAGTAAPVNKTIYGRIPNGQGALPTGTYLSTFSGNNALVQYAYSNANNCNNAPNNAQTQSIPFVVRVTNNSSCTVVATDLAFGLHGNLTSAKTATNTITLTCTGGTIYDIAMSNGSGGGTGPTARLMANVATPQKITYGIYRDAAFASPWGSTSGSNTAAGTGTGAAQVLTGYGRVPAQSTPPSLTYTDTVLVTVTY